MSIKDDVKKHLESIAPEADGPTAIGKALGFDYGRASSSVTQPLRALIKDGWAERLEKPVRYRKITTK